MLAHELCHVVQQRGGAVDASPRPDGVNVSDPSDRFEQAAEAKADAVMSASATAAPIAPGGARAAPSRGRAVQRFLAGEYGHGGIEEGALQEAGFSEDEAHQTYFGNWLRDYSQQLDVDKQSGGAWLEIIKVLATGEFGRAPTDEELGQYLPSEHVDNPAGGASAENMADPRQAGRQSHLSKSQQAWVTEEQSASFKNQIAAASRASGLPDYIERAKEHVRRQLIKSAELGRNRDGERELGNGLHAVEDYFAHSTFTEVALSELVPKDVAPTNPLVRALRGYYRVQPDKLPAQKFGPGIITGTSEGQDTPTGKAAYNVGKAEAIKVELKNAEVRKAFVRGALIRYGWNAPRAGAHAAFGAVGKRVGEVVGGVAGGVGGFFSGAASGAAAGWRGAKHWWQKPGAALGGLFKGAFAGAGRGAKSGAKTGERVGEKVGGVVGDVLGAAAGVVLTGALFAVIFPLYLAAAGILGASAGPIESWAQRSIKENTRKTVDPKRAGQPTTHSQIAKDDVDQPLHNAAAALAHEADVNFGRMMIEVWAHRRPVSDVTALVDVYMAHPKDPKGHDWWKPILIKAANAVAAPARAPSKPSP